jgi:hypothetical protein
LIIWGNGIGSHCRDLDSFTVNLSDMFDDGGADAASLSVYRANPLSQILSPVSFSVTTLKAWT